ncbi:hypothetical protein FF38_06018, partial [Lucilia cuprina]
DPEFPYQIPILDFDLHLPLHYPHKGDVIIKVNNDNIPRGIAINIEQGFLQSGSLADRINNLDNNLESLVAKTPARTIFHANIDQSKGNTLANASALIKRKRFQGLGLNSL